MQNRPAKLKLPEWLDLPESHRLVAKRWQECNWLQAMEGGIDSSHVSFLHRDDRNPVTKLSALDTAPRVAATDDGAEAATEGVVAAASAPDAEVADGIGSARSAGTGSAGVTGPEGHHESRPP